MKFAFSIIALLATVTVARADIPPPNSAQCGGKKTGDACTLDEGGDGHCVETTCSRARPDGNSEYACTLCEPGAPASAEPAPSTATGATSKGCTAGGLESVLALGGLVTLLARRRRT